VREEVFVRGWITSEESHRARQRNARASKHERTLTDDALRTSGPGRRIELVLDLAQVADRDVAGRELDVLRQCVGDLPRRVRGHETVVEVPVK